MLFLLVQKKYMGVVILANKIIYNNRCIKLLLYSPSYETFSVFLDLIVYRQL